MKTFLIFIKEVPELFILVIVWIFFDYQAAIAITLGCFIGSFLHHATEALKRYQPTKIFIENATIEQVNHTNNVK